MTRQLVLVAGAGRSGTSTMAGALHLLGYHLPRPVLHANESNPKGFFESRWPVRFHKRLLEGAVVEQTDGRPAAALVGRQVDDTARAELRGWLATQFAQSRRVLVKDPRAAWAPGLWISTAAELGADTAVVTMLRPPQEVVRSRGSHYAKNRPYMDEVGFAVMNLAGWVNANLTVERLTRGHARAFVRYEDLRADWRSALRPLRDGLDLSLSHDLGSGPHPEVDAFIEPSLNRHEGTWEGLGLPEELVGLADDLARELDSLVSDPHDGVAQRAVDEVGSRYAELYRRASLIAVDTATAKARTERRRGFEEGLREGQRTARDARLHRRIGRRVRGVITRPR